ncbi:MAG: hypothetical protein J0L61_09035, partial [Planctomycetes bacterium]|nr:hypothetical protein [Planctomycetota bacterium]
MTTETPSGSQPPSDSASTPRESSDLTEGGLGAKHLYEHYLFLWNDQVACADQLREKRKIYASVLGLIGALGAFRFEWSRRADEIPVIQHAWAVLAVRCCLCLALVFLAVSMYWLFTQKPGIRPVLHAKAAWLCRMLRIGKTEPVPDMRAAGAIELNG